MKPYLLLVLMSCISFSCGEDKPKKKFSLVEKRRQLVLQKKSTPLSFSESKKIELKISELNELILNPGRKELIAKKYSILGKVLEQDLKNIQNHPKNKFFVDDGKTPYRGKDLAYTYYPDQIIKQVKKVNDDYGYLYINETTNKVKNTIKVISYRAEETPWTGWWGSDKNNSYFYQGENSPLQKLEKWAYLKTGQRYNIAQTEKERINEKFFSFGNGMCDGLSFASVLTHEPREEIVDHGVYFSIADQKSILTYGFLGLNYKQYGMTYRVKPMESQFWQDLKPEAFHRLVEHFLGEKKQAIVIDETSGPRIWNAPLYKYKFTVKADPECPKYAFIVEAALKLTKRRYEQTDILTDLSKDYERTSYLYRLYVDKNDVKNGKYRVVAGQWLGDSFKTHPDNVKIPQDSKLNSRNSEFNKIINIVDELFVRRIR